MPLVIPDLEPEAAQGRPQGGRRGLTLVEVLAATVILAILAGISVPLYASSRRASMGRGCSANIATIAAAETAYALKYNSYTTSFTQLTGHVPSFTYVPVCPLDGTTAYTLTISGGALTIACPNAARHAAVIGTAANYTKTLPAVDSDTKVLP